MLNPVQQISSSSIDFTNTKLFTLSINLKIDGLVFVVLHKQEIVKAEAYEWPVKDWQWAISQFKRLITDHLVLKHDFAQTTLLIQSQECCLIPNTFFNTKHQNQALTAYLGKEITTAANQPLKQMDAHLVYNVESSIKAIAAILSPRIQIQHQSALLIDYELRLKTDKPKVVINVGTQAFEVLGFMKNKLVGHTFFNYQTHDEFLFLLLSFVKQSGFEIENMILKVHGKIMMNSRIGQSLSKYFADVQIGDFSSEKNTKETPFIELKTLLNFENN